MHGKKCLGTLACAGIGLLKSWKLNITGVGTR